MVRTKEYWSPRFYFVGSFFPYQVAVGLSIRWWERRPHIRIYLGPFKAALGLRS